MEAPLPPLDDRLSKLFARTTAGIRPGLETIRALLAELGNPETKYPVIHIAGTNGKGSVAAMIASMLEAHRLSTGLYTSPHLVRFHERIRINGQDARDDQVEDWLNRTLAADAVQAARHEARPGTFFELGTAMAFDGFARSNIHVAVVECGLGGRWDATNVAQNAVCVIAPVSFDHTHLLGPTLDLIAGEKAGILREGRPLVLGPQPEAAEEIILAQAKALHVPVLASRDTISITRSSVSLDGQRVQVSSHQQDYGTITLPLLGAHQLDNLAMALSAVEIFFDLLDAQPDAKAIRKGLASTRWPARLHVLDRDPPTLLDGAHNPSGAEVLRHALEELFGKKRGAFVMGFSDDKDVPAILQKITPCIARGWAVAARSTRAMPPETIAALSPNLVPSSLPAALSEATDWARENDTYVCICGSLYLAGEILLMREHLS